MVKIVLDTNFLMVPFQFKVDILGEGERLIDGKAEFVVLSACLGELKKLAEGKGADARAARAALVMVEKNRLNTVPAAGPADRAIVDYAVKEKAIVFTNDRELRGKLKENGVRSVGLRAKSHLAFI